MKMIINGFCDPVYSPVVLNILDTFKVNYCHIIYSDFKINVSSDTKTIFHDVARLPCGDYGVDWNKITPLDEELIESMSDCESVALKMMDRHLHVPNYNDRKRIYLKHLRYWNHVLSENKIDLFLSSTPPHEVYDYILYCLCKLKKINTISLFQIMASDVILMMDDWENISYGINEKYLNLLKLYESVPEKEINLKGGLKNDFEFQISKKNPTPHYMFFKNPTADIARNLIRRIFNLKLTGLFSIKKILSFIHEIIYGIKIKIVRFSLFKFYNLNTTQPNMEKKFIYFPLHMQPEATTSPLAGAFVNQILTAQMIAYFLPKDIYLYVKEHPFQTNFGRDVEFYKELLRMPQVCLIPLTFNTFDLINNSIAVATATGTVGWEALYRGKPILLFGHCYYQYAKGVFMIRTNEDCQQALNKIINENFKPNIKDIKIYLKSLEDNTIEGYTDLYYRPVSHITELINNKNIIDKLTKKIKSVCLVV